MPRQASTYDSTVSSSIINKSLPNIGRLGLAATQLNPFDKWLECMPPIMSLTDENSVNLDETKRLTDFFRVSKVYFDVV